LEVNVKNRDNKALLVCVAALVLMSAFHVVFVYVYQAVNQGTKAPTLGIIQQLNVASGIIQLIIVVLCVAFIGARLLFYVVEGIIYLWRLGSDLRIHDRANDS
jgi:hypothetical protein